MKNWLTTAGVGLVCFLIGFFVNRSEPPPEAQTEDQSETRTIKRSSSVGSRSAHMTSLTSRMDQLSPGLPEKVMGHLEVGILEEMFFELAKTDWQAAAQFLSENPDLETWDGMAAEFVNYWRREDPKAAYEWIQQNRDHLSQADAEVLAANVLVEYSKTEPEKVAEILSGMKDSSAINELAYGLAGQWGKQDPEAALKWLDSDQGKALPDDLYLASYDQVMQGFIAKKPDEAAYYVTQLDDSPLKQSLVKTVAGEIASRDLNEARAWVNELPDQASKQAGLLGIVKDRVREDAEAVFGLLLENPDAFQNNHEFTSEAFGELVGTRPSLVIDRFSEIPQEAQPVVAFGLVSDRLERSGSSKEIENWVSNLPPGNAFDQGASALARGTLYEQPAHAMSWVGRIGNVQHRGNLVQDIVSSADASTLKNISSQLNSAKLSPEDQGRISTLINSRLDELLPALVYPEGK